MIKHKQDSGHVGVGLLAVLIIFVIVAAGIFVWQRRDTHKDAAYTPEPATPCEGEWFDTHTHQDEMEFSQDLANQMRANKVGCSLIFTHFTIQDPEISMLKLREEYAPNPGRFVLFADVIGESPLGITRDKLNAAWAKHQFMGMGESAFYREPLTGTSLTAEPWPTIFKFAAEKDAFVMLHLTARETDSLEQMLVRYPNTKVLLHHNELKDKLADMLKRHENLYYTLDVTNLTSVSIEGGRYDVLMFPNADGDSSALGQMFLEKLAPIENVLLDEAVKTWLPVIEAAPNRVMWGTDVALDWHLEPEVYKKLIEFSEAFVNKLPGKYQEDYKFGNAINAFGRGSVLKPLTKAELEQLDAAEGGNEDADDKHVGDEH